MQVSGYSQVSGHALADQTALPPDGGSVTQEQTSASQKFNSSGISFGASQPLRLGSLPELSSNAKMPLAKQNAEDSLNSLESLISSIIALLSRSLASADAGEKNDGSVQGQSRFLNGPPTYGEALKTPPAYGSIQPPFYEQATRGQDDQMSPEEVVTTLGRHEGLFKHAHDSAKLKEISDDPGTPSDAQKAIKALLAKPDLFRELDGAKTEGKKFDGKISADDIRRLQDLPQVRAYADAKAETYTHTYVPSDAKPGSPPREMTANDAMRELFQYSESLPRKNIDLRTLQKIADGSQNMGKSPPQLAAAAKFFTQHPDQWQSLTRGDNGKVSRDRLCDLAAENINLSPQESKAVETLQNNRDIFFKGGLKPGKLKDIANDEKNSKEVRDAANLLAQPHSMLFSMLDNGKHGAGGNFFNKANDKKIGGGDLDAFVRKGTNKVAHPPTLSGTPTTKDALDAKEDMDIGQETQPDNKKEKGGGIWKLLDIMSWVGSALLAVVPGGAAVTAANAARVAGSAIAKEVVKQSVKQGTELAAKQTAVRGAVETGKQGAMVAGKEGAKDIAKDVAKETVKNGIKDYAKDYTKEQIARIEGEDTGIDAPRVWAQT